MNLANKKFKKLVQETYQSVMLDVVIGFHDFCKGKISQELVNAALDNLVLFSLTYPEEKVKLYNKLNKEYLEKNKDKSKFYSTLQTIIEHYDKQLPYLYFNELISTFDYFKIPDNERADILAYFLNKNIINITTFDFENEAEKIQSFLDQVKMSNYRSDITLESILSKKDTSIAKCKDLRNIINIKGDIVPNKNAVDYKDNLKYVFFDTDEYHLDLIIKESEKRAFEIEQKKKEQTKNVLGSSQPKELSQEELNAIYEEQIKCCKIQRQAVQKLKNYLNDNKPIKFLNSGDIIEINKALKVLNYSNEEIMKIQKNIVTFNNEYKEQLMSQHFIQAKESLLSTSEQEILDQAENIINDENALKNPFFFAICENYKQVKEKLLQALELKSNTEAETDEYELIIIEIMCILDDLSNAIENYNYSNFKKVPKKDNN